MIMEEENWVCVLYVPEIVLQKKIYCRGGDKSFDLVRGGVWDGPPDLMRRGLADSGWTFLTLVKRRGGGGGRVEGVKTDI